MEVSSGSDFTERYDTPLESTSILRIRTFTLRSRSQQYNRRCGIVEPVFDLIKEQRGCRRFLFRGLKKVAAEWGFLCAVTNLWKLFRFAPQANGA